MLSGVRETYCNKMDQKHYWKVLSKNNYIEENIIKRVTQVTLKLKPWSKMLGLFYLKNKKQKNKKPAWL